MHHKWASSPAGAKLITIDNKNAARAAFLLSIIEMIEFDQYFSLANDRLAGDTAQKYGLRVSVAFSKAP